MSANRPKYVDIINCCLCQKQLFRQSDKPVNTFRDEIWHSYCDECINENQELEYQARCGDYED